METTTGFLIYAGLFRLAIIGTGALTVYLGYKLFVRGVMPEGRTEAGLEAGDIRLTVKNAAPGTCFALFGVALIGLTMVQGSPELVISDVERVDSLRGQSTRNRGVKLKGSQEDDETVVALERFKHSFEEAQAHGQRGDNAAALTSYAAALSQSAVSLEQAARVFNGIAWIYSTQDRIDEALPLARIAVVVDRQQPAYLDTLANVLLKRRELDEALGYAQKAVELSPDSAVHLHTLARIFVAKGDRTQGRMYLEKAVRLDPRYQAELDQLDSTAQ